MAKKNRVVFGQCYEKNDHVYMIKSLLVQYNKYKLWAVEDITSKEEFLFNEKVLLKLSRPFKNFG